VFCEGPVGLGNRHLSTFNLSLAGQQPMMFADGRYVLKKSIVDPAFRRVASTSSNLSTSGQWYNRVINSDVYRKAA
jgi:hypothetical protein